MKLAEARPLRRRLMAAMAQQDCGQCGYTCEEYANALFFGKEKRLNLCVPGGKETQRMLKALYAEMDNGATDKPAKTVPATAPTRRRRRRPPRRPVMHGRRRSWSPSAAPRS